MKIGLLGGTFDPVHAGHLVLAQECWFRLGLDKVIFIPAYVAPHKDVEGSVSAADRLNMVRLALEGDDRFGISTCEIDSGRISYTIETIKHFREISEEGTEIFFLTGADSAESLSMWKEVNEILSLVTFVIATRPGWGEKSPYEGRVKRVIIPGIEVSSSDIRERIRKREPIDYLVPASVVKYIRNKGLYRE
ncbi:MAG: nicotinate-nucleotide adenylyltransferase [Candidatus Omnitrophota bacterium]|nr:nicotinate-nucleotide adenylyltransferase [Candidatus Omnitrophota bacterium]